jgi:hypothetical protein
VAPRTHTPKARDTRLRIALCALAVAALTTLTTAPAAAARSPIRFGSQETVTVGDSPARVLLVNNSTTIWTVKARAILIDSAGERTSVGMETAQPATLRQVKAIVISPTTVTDASGFLVVTATSPRQRVRISLPIATAGAEATAEIAKWSGTSSTFLTTPSDASIPIHGPCAAIKEGQISVVSGDDVESVPYRCVADESSVDLDFAGLTQVGKYEGSLKIGETSVALTYLKARPWWQAMLAILAGFLIAAWAQTFLNNRRPIRRAHKALSDLVPQAYEAQKEFDQKAAGKQYANYTFTAAVTRKVSDLQGQLADLTPGGWRRPFATFLPQPKANTDDGVRPIAAATAALGTTVTDWPAFADALSQLEAALDGLTQQERSLAKPLVDRSTLILAPQGGDALSYEFASIDDCTARITETSLTTSALGLLPRVQPLRAALEDAEGNVGHEGDVAILDRARHTFNLAVGELAVAKDADELATAGVDRLLVSARRDLMRIPPEPDTVMAAVQDQDAEAVLDFGVLGAGAAIVGDLLGRLPALAQRVSDGLTRGAASGVLWLLIALLVALWTGMAALYVDKPWGSLGDIFAAIVWGIVATATLTPVLGAVEALMERPIAVARKGADGS